MSQDGKSRDIAQRFLLPVVLRAKPGLGSGVVVINFFVKTTLISLLVVPMNCLWLRERPTKPPAGTHKEIYSWVNEDFFVSPGSNKAFPFDCIEHDTVRGDITLKQGEYITSWCIIDDENYQKWKSNEDCEFLFYRNNSLGGEFYIWIPYTAAYHFVVINHLSETIWVIAEVTLERWEK
jgi:hypothetical protein